MRILKFLATGALGLMVNLGAFQTFYLLKVPYLIGSALAFTLAMVIGFMLQKFWTFDDPVLTRVRAQFALYAALALTNLAANTLIVYLLVEYAGTHYLLAQTIGAGSVAFTSYLIYRFYIFADTV